jgi:hypothetical protein
MHKRTDKSTGGGAVESAGKGTSIGTGEGTCKSAGCRAGMSAGESALLSTCKGAGCRAGMSAGVRAVNAARGNGDSASDAGWMGIAAQGASLARHHINHQVLNAESFHGSSNPYTFTRGLTDHEYKPNLLTDQCGISRMFEYVSYR